MKELSFQQKQQSSSQSCCAAGIVCQKSCPDGIFATLIAYLIDEQGIIMANGAVGEDVILVLIKEREQAVRDHIQTRLGMLRKELEKGQVEIQKVESQRTYLHETTLRISGAIQVLEELLAEGHPAEQNGAHSGEKQPLSGQVNPGNIMDPALQTPGLGDHDNGSRQNSPAVNMLGEKE